MADENRIRKIAPDGEVVTLRLPGVGLGRLDGLAVDNSGNVYVADAVRNCIMKGKPAARR